MRASARAAAPDVRGRVLAAGGRREHEPVRSALAQHCGVRGQLVPEERQQVHDALRGFRLSARVLAPAVELANEALEHRGAEPLPEGLTPHSLRRTFASLLVGCGEDPAYVMEQTGHTTPHLTLTLYARAMRRRDGERERLRCLVEGTAILGATEQVGVWAQTDSANRAGPRPPDAIRYTQEEDRR